MGTKKRDVRSSEVRSYFSQRTGLFPFTSPCSRSRRKDLIGMEGSKLLVQSTSQPVHLFSPQVDNQWNGWRIFYMVKGTNNVLIIMEKNLYCDDFLHGQEYEQCTSHLKITSKTFISHLVFFCEKCEIQPLALNHFYQFKMEE